MNFEYLFKIINTMTTEFDENYEKLVNDLYTSLAMDDPVGVATMNNDDYIKDKIRALVVECMKTQKVRFDAYFYDTSVIDVKGIIIGNFSSVRCFVIQCRNDNGDLEKFLDATIFDVTLYYDHKINKFKLVPEGLWIPIKSAAKID